MKIRMILTVFFMTGLLQSCDLQKYSSLVVRNAAEAQLRGELVAANVIPESAIVAVSRDLERRSAEVLVGQSRGNDPCLLALNLTDRAFARLPIDFIQVEVTDASAVVYISKGQMSRFRHMKSCTAEAARSLVGSTYVDTGTKILDPVTHVLHGYEREPSPSGWQEAVNLAKQELVDAKAHIDEAKVRHDLIAANIVPESKIGVVKLDTNSMTAYVAIAQTYREDDSKLLSLRLTDYAFANNPLNSFYLCWPGRIVLCINRSGMQRFRSMKDPEPPQILSLVTDGYSPFSDVAKHVEEIEGP
jgi:hypothetical protein